MLKTNKSRKRKNDEGDACSSRPIRAALYVRAACFTQAILDAQREALERYAEQNNLLVVRRYVEGGLPGKMRDELMKAVMNGEADFSVIIMRDYSRWGRWPEEEASARCEYFCRKAGIDVRYVDEEKFAKGKIDPTVLMKAGRNAVN